MAFLGPYNFMHARVCMRTSQQVHVSPCYPLTTSWMCVCGLLDAHMCTTPLLSSFCKEIHWGLW